jgi:hypothetical protein
MKYKRIKIDEVEEHIYDCIRNLVWYDVWRQTVDSVQNNVRKQINQIQKYMYEQMDCDIIFDQIRNINGTSA